MNPPVSGAGNAPTLEELEEKEAAAQARREQELERFGADEDDDEDGDEDGDGDGESRRAPPPEPPAPILFADVVSGQFDADEDSPEVALPKRVLTPQADTPKLHKV
ncbi:MAG: 23S rRNA pseudouridylate synthase B, partial [Ramlibacter sp.]|nr:23S rRNA pseudouridylate synthase B [Ramlibacter sp.]